MESIAAISDYQNRFGSKYFDKPYRSGMDKQLLKSCFMERDYTLQFLKLSDPMLFEKTAGSYVIYTSQEDPGYRYKSFIEDVVYSLELNHVALIPEYKYLRANNNKVFMEMLRKQLPTKYQNGSRWFGCAEEALDVADQISFPCVVKASEGAGSHGVRLVKTKSELKHTLYKLSRSRFVAKDIRDVGRAIRHKGYKLESLYRNKFIVQDFVPGLNNDWKVLVYWDKFYVLRRRNRPGDFRASGSGLFSFDKSVDSILLDAANEIRAVFNVPMISLDLAINENGIVLIEFQFVYFGSSTLEKSPYYYQLSNQSWQQHMGKSVLEEVYAYSISKFLSVNKR